MSNKYKSSQNLIESAASHFYAGKYKSAAGICQSIIKKQKNNVDAYNLLGIIQDKLGKRNDAIASFKKALKLLPENTEILNNLGTTHLDLHELEKAKKCFTKALSINENQAESHYNLGNVYYQEDNKEEAKKEYIRSAELAPTHAKALNNIGSICQSEDDFENAEKYYNLALHSNPNFIDALYNLSGISIDRKNWKQAQQQLTKLLSIDENHVRGNYFLGLAHFNLDKYANNSLPFYLKSFSLDNQQVDVGNAIAVAYHYLCDYDNAFKYLDITIELKPDFADAYNTKGLVYFETSNINKAIEFYTQAIELKPNYAEAYNNLGYTYKVLEEYDLAIQQFQKAISIRPEFASALNNLSLTELVLKKFDSAWHHYRYRPSLKPNNAPFCPDSLPSTLQNKNIYIIKDQGIGDEIFFLRFLPQLASAGANISYKTDKKLIPLLEKTCLFHTITDSDLDKSQFDITCSVGDLPYLTRCFSENLIPQPLPLVNNTQQLAQLQKVFSDFGPPPYIGLTWRAGGIQNNKKSGSYYKTIDIPTFCEFSSCFNGTFVSLQRNPQQEELDEIANLLQDPILNISPLNENLEQMLCALEIIDHYITMSNTNVHLRESLNKPSHILVPTPPEWRWLANGSTSLWMPNSNIYRQQKNGDWQTALTQFQNDIRST